MVQFPFRTPMGGDGDAPEEEEWSPPDYAKPVAATTTGEAWTPPSYAKAVIAKPKVESKPSWFAPAKRIHAGGDIPKPAHMDKGDIPDWSATADNDNDPRKESHYVAPPPIKHEGAISELLGDKGKETLKKVHEWATSSPKMVTDFTTKIQDYLTDPRHQIMTESGKGGVHDELANELSRFRGGVAGSLKAGIDSFTTPLNAALALSGMGEAKTGIKAFKYATKALSAPIIASGTHKLLSPDSSLSQRGAGLTEIAMGLGGMIHSPFKEGESAIRPLGFSESRKEIPYRMEDAPKPPPDDPSGPSAPPVAEAPPIKQNPVVDFIKNNPKASQEEINKFAKSVNKSKPDFVNPFAPKEKIPPAETPPASEVIPKPPNDDDDSGGGGAPDERPEPTRSPNLSSEHFPVEEQQPKTAAQNEDDRLFNMARERFNMGRDLPEGGRPADATPMTNPFDKTNMERMQSDSPPIIDDKGGMDWVPEKDQMGYTGEPSPELKAFHKGVMAQVGQTSTVAPEESSTIKQPGVGEVASKLSTKWKGAETVKPAARGEFWKERIDELDKIKAPDTDYRDILSTGGRSPLKKGETWRDRVQKYIQWDAEKTAAKKKKAETVATKAPAAETALAPTAASEFKVPELVDEGAPPIRQKTGNFFIDDSHRMQDEALSRRADPVRAAQDKAKNDEWEDRQENLRVTNELEKRLGGDKVSKMPLDEWKELHAKTKEERRLAGTNKPNIVFQKAEWKPPDYAKPAAAKAIEAPPAVETPPVAAKEPYTIENAPPNQRAKMFRGAHESIDILFNDTESREMFGAGQKAFGKEGEAKGNWYTRLNTAANRIASKFDIPVPQAKKAIMDYNAKVRELGSGVDKDGGDLTAPSFGDHIRAFLKEESGEAKINPLKKDEPAARQGIESERGSVTFGKTGDGLNRSYVNAQGQTIRYKLKGPPSTGENGPILDKLFGALGEAREKMEDQTDIYKKERARRFSEYASERGGGVTGAANRLSKLKGEYTKVKSEGRIQLDEAETGKLFDAVDAARITVGEKARGTVALFKLMNGDSVPQRNELAILDEVFGNNFGDKITEMHGGIGMVGVKIGKLANTMKSMENALSLAAPLRHGAGLLTHKEFYPAFRDMFKFFGDKEFYTQSMKNIQQHANFMLSREGGLFLSKPGNSRMAEEEFLNSYVGSIPQWTQIPRMVGASQRAYSGFLNKLRFDVFNAMITTAKGLGHESHTVEVSVTGKQQIVPSKSTLAISRFINNATGRGDLPFGLNKVTNELNLLMWSPRMLASRVNMFANPKIYMDLPKGMRREGLKTLLGIAGMGVMVNSLGVLGGAKVSTNILSTDFMKSRFPGNKVMDPNAGLQQFVVAAARTLMGKTDSPQPTSRLDIVGKFMANKESPAASLAHKLLTAQKFTGKADDPLTAGNFTTQYGEKSNIQSEIGKQFVPIFVQDLADLIKSEPKWSENIGLNTAMLGASLAGMSQSYPEKKTGKLGFKKMKVGIH